MRKVTRTQLEIRATILELIFGGSSVLVSRETIEEDEVSKDDEGEVIDVPATPAKALENKS
ncbi:MAG: hypothetical protein AAGI89_08780 [Pseudomonadota bacterium]